MSLRLTLFSYRLINLVPSARKGTTMLFKEETLRQMPVFDYGSLRGVARMFPRYGREIRSTFLSLFFFSPY